MKLPQLVLVGAKLALICTVAAVVLGLINAVTAPVIVENREQALAEGLNAVAAGTGESGLSIGSGRAVEESESITMVYPITQGTEDLAYILQLVGVGYGGDMQLLAGYYPTGELFSAKMMENQETPGLGKKAESDEYMEKFIGFGADARIPVSKTDLPGAQADSITGATITFIGVARALADGSEAVRRIAAGGNP